MTIDEAIAQEIAFSKEDFYKRKEYHEQLAEWLEELKDLREYFNSYEVGKYRYKRGYNKAIDDLIEAAEKSQYGDVDGKEYVMEHLKALAEQLKAGGRE